MKHRVNRLQQGVQDCIRIQLLPDHIQQILFERLAAEQLLNEVLFEKIIKIAQEIRDVRLGHTSRKAVGNIGDIRPRFGRVLRRGIKPRHSINGILQRLDTPAGEIAPRIACRIIVLCDFSLDLFQIFLVIGQGIPSIEHLGDGVLRLRHIGFINRHLQRSSVEKLVCHGGNGLTELGQIILREEGVERVDHGLQLRIGLHNIRRRLIADRLIE